MMNEFTTLVKDTRLYVENIQAKKTGKLPIKRAYPVPISPSAIPQIAKQNTYNDTKEPQLEVEESTIKTQELLDSPKKERKWQLHPFSASPLISTATPHPWRQKLAAYVKTCEPVISVFLLLPKEQPSHRLFLENVARAITRTFAPATVQLFEEKYLLQQQKKVFLTPLTQLKSLFPEAQCHHPIKHKENIWIPLQELDLYEGDISSKRALWIAIQHSFQSLSI